MMRLFLTLLTGIVLGVIDVLPMLKMKLDKYACASAFVFYLVAPFIVFNVELFSLPWWLKGSVVTFLLALPVIILVAKDGVKGVLPITAMSIVLGALTGVAGHFIQKL